MRVILIILASLFFFRSDAQTTYDCAPIGWYPVLANARDVVTGIDTMVKRSGKASGFIKRPPTLTLGSGSLKQALDASAYKGQHVKLTVYLKALDLEGAYIWFRADKLDTAIAHVALPIEIPNFSSWTPVSCTLDVPENALVFQFGIVLQNQGTIWFDDCTIEIVDRSIPAFNSLSEESKTRRQPPRFFPTHPKPMNLDFEDQ